MSEVPLYTAAVLVLKRVSRSLLPLEASKSMIIKTVFFIKVPKDLVF